MISTLDDNDVKSTPKSETIFYRDGWGFVLPVEGVDGGEGFVASDVESDAGARELEVGDA